MILVFGGTTEGRKVCQLLTDLNTSFLYSTKTNIGLPAINASGEAKTSLIPPKYRWGELNEASLAALVREEQIATIIYAAHPFATQLAKTVAKVSEQLKILVLALERTYPERDNSAHYVADYSEAIECLEQLAVKNLLALTGVQTISKLKPFWKKHKTTFRILDRETSRTIAKESNFPADQLVFGKPSKILADEIEMIRSIGAQSVICKESGESGFLPVKIEAAKHQNIPILIIKRPNLPENFKPCSSLFELSETLKLIMK